MDRCDLFGESGAVYTLEFRGKHYRMSRLTGRLQSEWEMWLRKEYLRIKIHEPLKEEVLTPEMHKELLEDYHQKVEDGFFAIDGPHSDAKMKTQQGQVAIAWISFKKYHPEMDAELLSDLMLYKGDDIEMGFQVLHAGDLARGAELSAKKGILEAQKQQELEAAVQVATAALHDLQKGGNPQSPYVVPSRSPS